MKNSHKNIFINDYNKYIAYYEEEPSDDFYRALAWEGLRNQNVNVWDNLDEDKKQIIENLRARIGILTQDCSNE